MAVPRPQRLREEIKREASDIIQRRMKDPRIGFTTVTDVEVIRDLRHVKIFVSVLGDEETRAADHRRTGAGERVRPHGTRPAHPPAPYAGDPV